MKMTLRSLRPLAGIAVVMFGITTLASAAPGGGTVNTSLKSHEETADGCGQVGSSSACFFATSFIFQSGAPSGVIEAYGSDGTSSWDIFCFGPQFANAVKVVGGNGNSSVKAVLDPSSPDCFASNVSSPVTLNLSGAADGDVSVSEKGTGKATLFGINSRFNLQSDRFSETFSGAGPGGFSTFQGNAALIKRTDWTQLK